MGKPLTAFFTIAILLCAANTRAAVRTARIFSDHMVLQRELPVPIWGTAELRFNFSYCWRVGTNGERDYLPI